MTDNETSSTSDSVGAASVYEFDADQNKLIGNLAGAMLWLAVPLRVIDIIYGFSAIGHIVWVYDTGRGLLSVLLLVLAAILYFMLGTWTKNASESFSAVVSTEGNDIGHLMTALDNLRKKYSLLSLFVKLYLAMIAIGLIATGIMWMMGNFD